jgi:anti-sigma B factor antagonist
VLTIHQDRTPEGYLICRLAGELDAFTVSQFRQTLGEMASTSRLLIDLSEVSFVDSAGLGALIGGIRRTPELGGDVAVACNRPTLIKLLRTTGVDRIVTVADTGVEGPHRWRGEGYRRTGSALAGDAQHAMALSVGVVVDVGR